MRRSNPSPSSPRKRGPIRRGPSVLTVVDGFVRYERRWLWVPAFAGTTFDPSLRANGSRECAPDDRLREAIHSQSNGDNGLLRRFAPRNDGTEAPPFSVVIAREGGRSSIPETPVMESRSRGVLDRPVKPDDDGFSQ
jgi:hypothetical protein